MTAPTRRLPTSTTRPQGPDRRSQTARDFVRARSEASAALSLGQLSTILDPFFDTCAALRAQQQPRTSVCARTSQPRAAAVVATAATAVKREESEQRHVSTVGGSFLSVVSTRVATGGASSDGLSQGGDALRDSFDLGNSAWMDMVQEMEAEKNDHLRLGVAVA